MTPLLHIYAKADNPQQPAVRRTRRLGAKERI
jgi:hypothetical protein